MSLGQPGASRLEALYLLFSAGTRPRRYAYRAEAEPDTNDTAIRQVKFDPVPVVSVGRNENVQEMHRGQVDVRSTGLATRPSDVPIPVLYIAGEGRSGSTILSAILGNHAGYFPVGELPDVWQALQTNELCGCGQPFANCPFWRAVGNVAFGGWDSVKIDEILQQEARYTRHRRIFQLIRQSRVHQADAAFHAYCERLGQLYSAIREVSGCSVIVDSTKRPPFAMLLRNVPSIELRVVHLVRDSRGVAFSWNKVGIRNVQYSQHPTLKDSPMPTIRPWKSALRWDLKNLLIHALIPASQRLFVRYECFTSEPNRELDRIFQFAEANKMRDRTQVIPTSTFTSKPFHTLGGNPVRFTRGSIDVRVDAKWHTEMPAMHKLIVGGLTFPLLFAYGYIAVPWAHSEHTIFGRHPRRTQQEG